MLNINNILQKILLMLIINNILQKTYECSLLTTYYKKITNAHY